MYNLDIINKIKRSPLHNYGGIPGLTSWLLSEPSERGVVRLMECSREHEEPIIPHSHRFDLTCLVLAGVVRNLIWQMDEEGDEYQWTRMVYGGAPGEYKAGERQVARAGRKTYFYKVGQQYSMTADQVHSIFFSRGAVVLFFEGPQVSDSSLILEPVVNGVVVPTFKVEPWAFQKGAE